MARRSRVFDLVVDAIDALVEDIAELRRRVSAQRRLSR